MNIIRTKAVELSLIPAIAYKQKLASGGAGVKLLRLDRDVSAVATIDRRTGEPVSYGKVDFALFPMEAFDEAIELLEGLPYTSRGNIAIQAAPQPAAEDVAEQPPEKVGMVGSDEYKAIIDRYSDETGRLNYQLMNKDFIQFAAKSKTVADMIGSGASPDDILLFVIKSRAAFISGKKDSLDDNLVQDLMETLDEIDPRSAFKELKAHIKRQLARRK